MKKNLLLILSFCLCITSVAQTEDVAADSLPWPQNLRVKVDSVLMTPLLTLKILPSRPCYRPRSWG